MKTIFQFVAAAWLPALFLAPECPAVVRSNFVVVAANGNVAPGTGGAQFAEFYSPSVSNTQGEVAFMGRLNWVPGSIDTLNDDGIWAGPPGQLQLVAREKDPVPDAPPGTTYYSFSTLRWTDGGFIAFAATLQGPGVTQSNDTCFMAGYPGAIHMVVREGMPAAGCAPGETYGDLGLLAAYPYVSSRAGEVVFRGTIGNAVSNSGTSAIWGGAPDSIQLLARQKEAVPGRAGVNWGTLLFTSPRINPNGQFTFNTTLSGTGISLANDAVLGIGTIEGTGVMLQEGQAVNAIPGATFRDFANASLNSRTQLCFMASFNTGVFTNDTGLFVGPPGNLAVIAREGSQVPGLAPGVVFEDLWLKEPVWNESGLAAFVANIKGPGIGTTNRVGVWVANKNVMHLLCRPGDPAPGAEPGVIFHQAFSGTFDIPVMNNAGNVAFSSMIEGAGIGITNNEAIFVGPPHFVQLILQRNDQIQLVSNDLRTVFTFDFVDGNAGSQPSGGQDGRSRCLNDRNQFLFTVTFQAGQGSALCLVNDVTDPNNMGLPVMAQRAFGLASNETTGQALPQWQLAAGQLQVTYRQATNEPYLETTLEQTSLLGTNSWQGLDITNQIITGSTNLPENVELRAASIPIATNTACFFRTTVRSLLWNKQ